MGLFSRKKKTDKNGVGAKASREAKGGKGWFGRKKNKVGPAVPKENIDAARNMSGNFVEHTWTYDVLLQNFPTSGINISDPAKSTGLSAHDAYERLIEDGPNALPKPKEVSDIELFFKQFLNLLWILLLVTVVLSFVGFLDDTSDLTQLWVTLIILFVIIGMCFVSFLHEREAMKVVRGFQNLLPQESIVIRDGKQQTISAEDLVVGDVIIVKNGNRVPADGRVFFCRSLKLETSSITGEAEPLEYHALDVPETIPVFDSRNIVFNGSMCVDGEAHAVVIRTGTDTVIGQIASLTTGQKAGKSRLEQQMFRFVVFLIVAATVIGLTVFVVGAIVHKWKGVIQLLCTGFLVCAICLVPTGMPATVTSIIALVARRLGERNVFLKRLDIVEALGSVNIIASDKTGTLTKNVMTVTDAWFYDEFIAGKPQAVRQTADRYGSGLDRFDSPVSDMLEIMAVCNAAKFVDEERVRAHTQRFLTQTSISMPTHQEIVDMEREGPHEKPATGAPTEIAMLRYADEIISINAARASYKIVFEIPFNSERKWHLMIAKLDSLGDGNAEYKLLIKGAPERITGMCSRIYTSNGPIDFDANTANRFQTAYDKFGSNGRRVLGFATTTFVAADNTEFDDKVGNFPLTGLTFAGICAIMDPPRDETAGAVHLCRSAGIKVFMVTGDHQLTAAAIAREINLVQDVPGKEPDYAVLESKAIAQLQGSDWDKLLTKNALVFARTTPEQKLMIVEECQKRGFIIAMTGDGVNDSPALKRADIGIAMGSGSDVAKQAADLILMDDNFASIVNAIQEGRMMFDNIKKLLAYVALHSTPEMLPIVLNFCFGFPLGISSLQILSIDLGTEIAPGIAMAKEPKEGDIMLRPPRRRDKVLTSNTLLFYSYFYGGMIQCIACFLTYMTIYWINGFGIGDLWQSSDTYWKSSSPDLIIGGKTFTGADQVHLRRQSCSATQMAIVVNQFFHLFNTRTRRQSIFTHGIFKNPESIGAQCLAIVLLCLMVYVPGLNTFMGGAPLPWQAWVVAIGGGLAMFIFNEIRKFFIRIAPTNLIVRFFKW